MKTATTETALPVETNQIRSAALVFRAINHPLRRQIMQLIHENKQMPVTRIYHKLEIEQSLASQHLAILRKAGAVFAKRDAKFIFYSVNYQRLENVNALAAQLTRGGY